MQIRRSKYTGWIFLETYLIEYFSEVCYDLFLNSVSKNIILSQLFLKNKKKTTMYNICTYIMYFL